MVISEPPRFRTGTPTSDHRRMRDIDLKTLRLFVAVCDHRQHRARRRAGAHRAVGDQQAHRPARGRPRHAAAACAAGAACSRRRPGRRCSSTRATCCSRSTASPPTSPSFSSGVKGHVRLVATASAIAESLLDDIASFMREPANRNIQVDIEERVSRDLVRQVRDGSASLGVCWDSVDFEGLAHRPYRRDRLALAVHAGHPLAGRKSLRFEQTLDLRARRPAAVDGGAHDAAARRGPGRRPLVVPGHRLDLRRRVSRRRRQPRHQRRPGSRSAGARGGAGIALVPLADALGRAPLRDLLSPARRAAAGEPAAALALCKRKRLRRARSVRSACVAHVDCWGSFSPKERIHGIDDRRLPEPSGADIERLAKESMHRGSRSARRSAPSAARGRHRDVLEGLAQHDQQRPRARRRRLARPAGAVAKTLGRVRPRAPAGERRGTPPATAPS